MNEQDYLKSLKLLNINNNERSALKRQLISVKIFGVFFLSMAIIPLFMIPYLVPKMDIIIFLFIIVTSLGLAVFGHKKLIEVLRKKITLDIREGKKYEVTATITDKYFKTISNSNHTYYHVVLDKVLNLTISKQDYHRFEKNDSVRCSFSQHSKTLFGFEKLS